MTTNKAPDKAQGGTARPWKARIVGAEDGTTATLGIVGASTGASEIIVCRLPAEVRPDHAAYPILQANAALIVAAVNERAALLARLEAAEAALDALCTRATVALRELIGPDGPADEGRQAVIDETDMALRAARAALAGGEGSGA